METDQTIEITEKEVNLFYFKKPNLIIRIKSMIIDTCVLIALIFISSSIIENFVDISVYIRMILLILLFFMEPVLVSTGGSIGQRLMGLRVVNFKKYRDHELKQNINLFNSCVRYIFKIILGWISLITVQSDKFGRAIHDQCAGSLMIFK